jgi:hypothetical protein
MAGILAALLTAVVAQEPQDRADLPPAVDTWYRVLQGKRQVGFIHETLKRANLPWRYEYALDAELELARRDRTRHEEDQSVTALLDESLSLSELSLETHVNEASSFLSLYTSHDERRIEGRPASAKEPLAWSVPLRDELHVVPTLTLYALRQSEVLSKPGRTTLRAIDPRGGDKAGVEVVLEVGRSVRRSVLGRDIPGTPVVFLKPFPAATRETELREAFVDRFGRILEATLSGGARIVITATRDEALAEIGPVHRHGRRDPMDKLAALRNAARDRGRVDLPDAGPPPTLDSLASDLEGVRKLLEQVAARRAEGDLEAGRNAYLQALQRLKAIRELASTRRPEMLAQIDAVREDAELAWDGAVQLLQEARTLYVQVEEQMARLDCEAVDHAQRQLETFRDRIEVERRPERDEIARMAGEAGTLALKCRTRRELARTRLEVTGIIMGEKTTLEAADSPLPGLDPVKFVQAFAWVEINGQVYRAGDTIAGTSIRVSRITRHSVEVSLRDELRDLGLRR